MTSSIKLHTFRNYYALQKFLTLLRNCKKHNQNICMSLAMDTLATF